MLSVQTLARRIRQRLHDTDCITYDDENILDCINCGVRFIRRIIARLRPALLMSEKIGTLAAGIKAIELDTRPTKIISVTANGRRWKKRNWHLQFIKPTQRANQKNFT